MRGGGGEGVLTRAEPVQRPHGFELPRAVGVGVSIRPAADGDAQRGFSRPAHPFRQSVVHVGAAVGQQREDIGVVVLGCHVKRRAAGQSLTLPYLSNLRKR